MDRPDTLILNSWWWVHKLSPSLPTTDETLFCSMSHAWTSSRCLHSLVCVMCVSIYTSTCQVLLSLHSPSAFCCNSWRQKDFWTNRPLVLLVSHKMALLLASYIASICGHKQEHLHPHPLFGTQPLFTT